MLPVSQKDQLEQVAANLPPGTRNQSKTAAGAIVASRRSEQERAASEELREHRAQMRSTTPVDSKSTHAPV
eukprot:3847390-Amphidinium_carterae.1